jgi:anaerobic selenocysteine-containing dehydrogenase
MHNSERLMRGKPRCTLLIHPCDSERFGVVDGQRVRVKSRVGELTVEVELSEAMMPGVVSLPHGWGHAREGIMMRTAERHAGVSINDVTDECAVDALSGNAVFNGVAVVVEPCD